VYASIVGVAHIGERAVLRDSFWFLIGVGLLSGQIRRRHIAVAFSGKTAAGHLES
jgi:hypothetical protein